MRRLQILRGQLQYKPELKDGEFFLDKTNHSLLIGDTAVADGQFELAKVSAITNLQQQLDTTVPTSTSQLTNDSGFITSAQAPVQSVDGATGAVTTNAVKYTSQALTDAQKTQARTNIGAGTSSFSGSYNDLDNKPAIPNKTSELTNDSNFITSAGAPVQSVNSKTGTVTLSASDVGAVPNTRTVNGKALSANITLTASDVGALPDTTVIPTVPVYSLTKDATSADYAAVYHLTKDGTNVGEPINIPKDLFVESGEIVDNPTGQPAGKYIKLTLQNQEDPIYINVADLVDAYTAGNGITISDNNVVSANVSAGNGLSVDANGIKMGAASSTSAGAMSSADFTKLSGIETGAQKNTVTSVNGSTGAVTITVPTKVTDLTDAADYATVTSVNAVADDVEMLNDEVGTLTTDVSTLKTNITSKQNTITGGASTITDNNLTASRALISNSSGKVAVSDITATELGYLDGVTSNIQTQIDGITVPTKTSELTNDSGYITQSDGDDRYLQLTGGTVTGPLGMGDQLNMNNNPIYAASKITTNMIDVSIKMTTDDLVANGTIDFRNANDEDRFTLYNPNISIRPSADDLSRIPYYISLNSNADYYQIYFSNPKLKIIGLTDLDSNATGYYAANKNYVDQYATHATLVTLTVAGWDSTSKTQTVTVSGILADESKQLIIPMPAAASMTAYNDAGIQCTGQAANSLTFTATTVPTAAISVYVTYQAVIS